MLSSKLGSKRERKLTIIGCLKMLQIKAMLPSVKTQMYMNIQGILKGEVSLYG